jgi:hypothetical protein
MTENLNGITVVQTLEKGPYGDGILELLKDINEYAHSECLEIPTKIYFNI